MAVAFHESIHQIYQHTFELWAAESTLTFAWRTLVLMMAVSLVAGWLVGRRCPEAGGSGIPQLKLAFWKDFGLVSPRILWVKFLAGALSIGGGMSLGREGPSVQMAGAVASMLAARIGVGKARLRMPAAAGAAAGLAAAFNTPLAAVTFVLEEIIGDLNSRFLGNVLMASVIGAVLAHGLLGAQPAFHMTVVDEPNWVVYVLTPWAAACATFVGLVFQRASLGLRSWSKSQNRVPTWLLPTVGALACWAIGVLVWQKTGRLAVFSLGYQDLSDALSGKLVWTLALLLLAAKLAATIACYGFGGCGGIFSPSLFLGGMAGLAAAGVGGLVFTVHESQRIVLAVVGMCACLGAVVRAPVTGILIVFEMTHEFGLVLPLMLGALVSQAISRRLMVSNFYDAILEQDGHHLTRIIPPRDLEKWQQLPVSAIANFYPAALSGLGADEMRQMIEKHPYASFPLVENGCLSGVVSRASIERALLTATSPDIEEPAVAAPQEHIRAIQSRIIDSSVGVVWLCDEKRRLMGLVTLHDLLRAQMSLGGSGE